MVGCCFGVGRCWEMIKIVDIGSDYLILIKLRLVDMMSAGNYGLGCFEVLRFLGLIEFR